jgi:hypothetical protein
LGSLDAALTLGGAVLDRYFGGDLEAWRGRAGSVTLRGLASEPGVSLSASTLYRYVAIAALCRKLDRSHFDHLGVSHLRQVLRLPVEEQVELLQRAEAERWTVRKLTRQVELRAAHLDLPRRGRRPGTDWMDALGHLRAWTAHPGRLRGLGDLERFEPEQRAHLIRLVATVHREVAQLLEGVGSQMPQEDPWSEQRPRMAPRSA